MRCGFNVGAKWKNQLRNWEEAGYRRIYILDNASTCKPLLAYYDAIKKQVGVEVLRMSNLVHMILWQADVLYKLGINGMSVYTYSDIMPVDAVCLSSGCGAASGGAAEQVS